MQEMIGVWCDCTLIFVEVLGVHLSLSLERVYAVRLYENFYLLFCLSIYAHSCSRLRVTVSVKSLSSNSAITSQHLRRAMLKMIGRYILRLICFMCYFTYSIPMKAGSKI